MVESGPVHDPLLTLSEAAERHQISAPTLRRLCDSGQIECAREGREWRVSSSKVERYLLTRRSAGNPAAVVRLEGQAPNPRLRDGLGWTFSVAIGAVRSRVTIWLTNDLVAIVREERDIRELVVGAAEGLIQEALLERDELPDGFEITLLVRDRSTLLRAAGAGPEHYIMSEAPIEPGVVVRREFGALDFARDALWPGDTLTDAPDGYEDVVVETWTAGAHRYVRTVRIKRDPGQDRRRWWMVRAACDAYIERCARTGQRPAVWLAGVLERIEALNLGQQRILNTTYEYFDQHGEWPPYKYIDAVLDKDYGVDLEGTLPAMPRQFLYGYPERYRLGERVTLSLLGLTQIPDAAPDLDLFVQVLRRLVDQQRNFIPDPSSPDQDLQITSNDILASLPAPVPRSDVALRKLYQLLQQDSNAWSGIAGSSDGSSWSLTISPTIRRYREVTTFSDYLEASGKLNPPPPLWQSPSGTGFAAQAKAWLSRPGTTEDHKQVASRGGKASAEGVPQVFVVMPFAPAFDAVYAAIRDACMSLGPSLNAHCYRSDDISTPGRITQQIVEAIRAADLIVADMTGANSNVLFEVGFADALDKPIIALNQDISSAPFDIRDWRQLSYTVDDLVGLRKRLVVAFLETLPSH